MKIEQRNWTVSTLHTGRDSINLNPRFQRGAAWQSPRQVLLIDSILRGMDIPRITCVGYNRAVRMRTTPWMGSSGYGRLFVPE